MNLAEIRELFIKRCGRYDLVTEDGKDNGADFFIQSGCRFLDRRSNVKHAQAGVHVCSVKEDGLVHLHDCWLIREVLVHTTDGRYPLEKLSSRQAPAAVFSSGSRPLFYIPKTVRYSPTLKNLPASLSIAPASAFDQQDMVSNCMMLEVAPRPRKTLPLEVQGNFYTTPLISDQDTNTWSELFPDTLVKAALYQLEIFYRNTEGANDWLVSIQLDLTDAEQMEVLADIQDKDTIGL